MIGLAKLVTGRLGAEDEVYDEQRHSAETEPSNYGISRLGLTPDHDSRSEALRPSFGDDVERGVQTPMLPKEVDPAPGPEPQSPQEQEPQPAPPVVEDPVKLPDNRPKGYKKTSVKMPRQMAIRLKAFSRATGNYQYAVIAEAVGRFLDDAVAELSDDTRRRMREMAEQFAQAENRSRWREIFSFRWK